MGELKKMMDDKTDVVILDTQPTSIYKKGHIKGASSFPWKENIALVETELLPRNRSIVLYCACGPGEGDSASVAAQLIDLGFDFDLVKVLKDPSIEGWKKAGYPME
ncbi:MAG TPA: rhodanese-like domain-containing protein [Syntrophorhabdaceae bacterium]|nr:rhodanese-like domain-containing protein [Syntrophorhabdaceae bacterium]